MDEAVNSRVKVCLICISGVIHITSLARYSLTHNEEEEGEKTNCKRSSHFPFQTDSVYFVLKRVAVKLHLVSWQASLTARKRENSHLSIHPPTSSSSYTLDGHHTRCTMRWQKEKEEDPNRILLQLQQQGYCFNVNMFLGENHSFLFFLLLPLTLPSFQNLILIPSDPKCTFSSSYSFSVLLSPLTMYQVGLF